jgi:hypothetical protein
MPSFTGNLKADELNDRVAFLRSRITTGGRKVSVLKLNPSSSLDLHDWILNEKHEKRKTGSAQGCRQTSSSHGAAHTIAGPNNAARAVVIKDEDLFLLCEPSGDVPLGNKQGFGLYYHDCRFLNGYALTIAGSPPMLWRRTLSMASWRNLCLPTPT